MSRRRKQYTKTEKLEMVKQSLAEDQTVKEVASRFGISEGLLYKWRSAYLKNEQEPFPGQGKKVLSETERRILDLERENKELRLERDILKKAVGIFSKKEGKFSNL